MTTQEKLIKSKLGLLELAAYLKNVSEACRVMGYSGDTFYRVKKAYEEGGIEALKEKNRKKPNFKNRVPEKVEQKELVEFISKLLLILKNKSQKSSNKWHM